MTAVPEPGDVDSFSYAARFALCQSFELGRYAIGGVLGHGRMGMVFKALDPEHDQWIALAVSYRGLAPEHADHLRREGHALARLSHPHVGRVYEVGEVEGRIFVAMELVEGQTLALAVSQAWHSYWADRNARPRSAKPPRSAKNRRSNAPTRAAVHARP